MFLRLHIPILIASALFLAGPEDDLEAPLIVIDAPVSGAGVRSGDTLLIDLLAYDDDLHELFLTITAVGDSTVEYHSGSLHTHDEQVRYREKFPVPAVAQQTDVVLKVLAVDMDEHERTKSVYFRLLP